VTDRAVCGNAVITVTIQASSHLERLTGFRLYFDFIAYVAVTNGACQGNVRCFGEFFSVNTVLNGNVVVCEIPNMSFMDEAYVIWEPVNAFPVDGRISIKGIADFLNLYLGICAATVDVLVAE